MELIWNHQRNLRYYSKWTYVEVIVFVALLFVYSIFLDEYISVKGNHFLHTDSPLLGGSMLATSLEILRKSQPNRTSYFQFTSVTHCSSVTYYPWTNLFTIKISFKYSIFSYVLYQTLHLHSQYVIVTIFSS